MKVQHSGLEATFVSRNMEWLLLFVYLVFICCVCGLPNTRLTGQYAWIEETFCTREGLFRHLPWDCRGYIQCQTGHSHWINCPAGLEFDGELGTCVFQSSDCMAPNETASIYCPQYPQIKFVHPNGCEKFYDCSRTFAADGFKIYENECTYPAQFDHIKMECGYAPSYCKNKPEKCDYLRECNNSTRDGDECDSLPDGNHADPVRLFLPNYIVCSGGKVSSRALCSDSKVFDPMDRTCVDDPAAAVNKYCAGNPTSKFADITSCSLYYDCSVRQHNPVLPFYKTECKYRHLFDVGTNTCKRFNKLTIPCETRKEPKAPVDYKVSTCFDTGYCIPRRASCIGLPDGRNPYPGLENTPFVIHCDTERTLGDFDKCTIIEVFHPGPKDCGLEPPPPTTTVETLTTTLQTPAARDVTPATDESTTTEETATATKGTVGETLSGTANTATTTENTPMTTKGTSEVTETTPTRTENTATTTENTPMTTKGTSEVTGTTPTRTENTATTTENTATTTENTPMTTKGTSEVTGTTPTRTKNTATTTENTATTTEDTPTTTKGTSEVTEQAPPGTKDTGTTTDATPVTTLEPLTTTEKTPTMTEKTSTGTEKMPTTTEGTATSGKTPTETEGTSAPTQGNVGATPPDPPGTTGERDTGTHSDCSIPPVCSTELEELKKNITILFDDTKFLTEKVNEKLPDPFECATPPTIASAKTQISYTSNSALATSECDEGFTLCGESLESTCMTDNEWYPPSGTCVQYLWTMFDEPVQTMIYNCPVKMNAAITLSGRYTGKSIVFSLTSPNETLVIDVPEPEVKQKGVRGILQWTIELTGITYSVFLNGNYFKGGNGKDFNNSDSLSLDISGGFKPEKVEFHPEGRPSEVNVESLPINLAYKRPVMATSNPQIANRVTDGENLVEWGDKSCWASTDADNLRVLRVDLGQAFSVNQVILTTAKCTKETCGTLEDVDIFVTNSVSTNYADDYTDNEICANVSGEVDGGQLKTIDCDKPLVGRFVTLWSKSKSKMVLCEVEVYGGHPTSKDWTPFKCPHPPLIPDATVKVSYTLDAAIATYKCNDAFGFCTKNNVIHCYGERGWDESPMSCLQTTVKSTFGNYVRKTDVCPLRLGSGLELWVTPEQDTGVVRLMNKDASKAIFVMTLDLQNSDAPIQFQGDTISLNPFTKAQEAHVVLTVLSGTLLVEVDGAVIHAHNIDSNLAMTADLFESSPEIHLRELNIRNMMPGLTRQMAMREDDKPENLALTMTAKSSSNYNNPPDIAFDEGLAANYDNGGCWHSDRGDEIPWIQVDLGSQYYIKSVDISLENVCPGCGGGNVALNKQVYGTDIDPEDVSSPFNVVDGNTDPDITKGSCFASAGPDAFLMVDLGGSYLIKEIKLFGETITLDKFGDMQIMVYTVNPQLVPTAVPAVCVANTGKMTSPQTLPCTTPVRGQFVKITKIDGADPILAMCEVEVYESLVDRLHDFDVMVYETDPATDTKPQLCHKFDGEFTVQDGILECRDEIAGRYVRLTARKQEKSGDLATVCEMKVFGAVPVKKEWTPYDCPNPELKEHAEVIVSRSKSRSTATYTCKEGYSRCTGNDVVHCEGPTGWIGSPAVCEQTTFSSTEAFGLGVIKLPCPLRLGQAIEIIFTPTSDTDANRPSIKLEEAASGDEVVGVYIKPSASLATLDGKDVPTNSFKVNKESRIVFTFLTKHMDITVDGVYLGKMSFSAMIDRVTTINGLLKRVRVIPASQTVAVDRSLVDNLSTLVQTVTASTTDKDSSRALAIDDDTSTTGAKCWIAANNDLDPYLLFEFKNFYYVERVVITTRGDCSAECADRTHDIEITAYYDVRPTTGEIPQLCAYRKGVIPADTDETILCERTVRGRYLKLRGLNRRNAEDQLTFCEVKLFGGEVIRDRATSQRTDPCPTDEGYLSVESPRLCFKLSAKTDVKNYASAQSECGVDGRLINIDTAEKYNYIVNSLTNMGAEAYDNTLNSVHMWVGLKANGDNFQWSGGSSYIEKWDGAEPSNGAGSVEECGQIQLGGFSDTSCDQQRRYICEIPIPLQK